MPDQFLKVATLSELSPGSMKGVVVGREEILLTNVSGHIYACSDVCTHEDGLLSEGDLDGVEVQCPVHGAIFNVTTGEVAAPPAGANIRVFEVRIEGQDVLVGPTKEG